jgi:hypothetical protein
MVKLRVVSFSEYLANGHRPSAIIEPVVIRGKKIIENDGFPINLTEDDRIGYKGIVRIPVGLRNFGAKPRVYVSEIFETREEVRRWIETVFEAVMPEPIIYGDEEREETEETDETEGSEIQG